VALDFQHASAARNLYGSLQSSVTPQLAGDGLDHEPVRARALLVS
jgi:hypothetical protein